MMPFILIWLKIKTNLIKLVLNTFISIKGPIILGNCSVLSSSELDTLKLSVPVLKVVLVIFQQYHYLEIEHHFRQLMLCRLWFDNSRANCCHRSVTNSRGFVGRVGCVVLWFVGLLRRFVSLKFKNPQTHIFKLRGLWFVGLAFKLM